MNSWYFLNLWIKFRRTSYNNLIIFLKEIKPVLRNIGNIILKISNLNPTRSENIKFRLKLSWIKKIILQRVFLLQLFISFTYFSIYVHCIVHWTLFVGENVNISVLKHMKGDQFYFKRVFFFLQNWKFTIHVFLYISPIWFEFFVKYKYITYFHYIEEMFFNKFIHKLINFHELSYDPMIK